jgi:hypothetical protein
VASDGLKLAYEAGVAGLKQQTDSLGNIRNRAAGVLAAAALVTSFGGGLGLIHVDQSRARLSLAGLRSCFWVFLLPSVLWLLQLNGLSRAGLMGFIQNWFSRSAIIKLDEDVLRRGLVLKMADAMRENSTALRKRIRFYQAAVGLLIAEVFTLVLSLMIS